VCVCEYSMNFSVSLSAASERLTEEAFDPRKRSQEETVGRSGLDGMKMHPDSVSLSLPSGCHLSEPSAPSPGWGLMAVNYCGAPPCLSVQLSDHLDWWMFFSLQRVAILQRSSHESQKGQSLHTHTHAHTHTHTHFLLPRLCYAMNLSNNSNVTEGVKVKG